MLWLFRERLGKVVDTTGVNVDITFFFTRAVKYFRVVNSSLTVPSMKAGTILCLSVSSTGGRFDTTEDSNEGTVENRWHQAWDRLREKAGWAALSLRGLAVTIFCSATVTGIAEGNYLLLWITFLSVVFFLWVIALVA